MKITVEFQNQYHQPMKAYTVDLDSEPSRIPVPPRGAFHLVIKLAEDKAK